MKVDLMLRSQALTRRTALALLGAGALMPWAAHGQSQSSALGLGFSLYGMKSLPLEQALKACKEIGYDCVELPVMSGWPLDSASWTEPQIAEAGALLKQTGLRLSALMENLNLNASDEAHAKNLERLRLAGRLAHGLSPDRPPVIETVLGGRPPQWPEVRQAMARRLGDWAETAEQAGVVIAIKAHVGGALHRPQDAVWLMQQAQSDAIRLAFDYSHFQLRNIPMAEAVEAMAPYTVFVHVKDAQGTAENFRFLLPGEGDIDYGTLFNLLKRAGYRGDVLVEVSGQIHSQQSYDPIAAARKCFDPLANAMIRPQE